jgi:hypothetical protein
MTRYATGPCLMKNVVIDGFNTGIVSDNQEYSITFENLLLENQLSVGIANRDNVLSIHNLIFKNPYAVSVHNALSLSPTTPDGDFKIQIEEMQAGGTNTLLSTAIQSQTATPPYSITRGNGLVVPLYTNKSAYLNDCFACRQPYGDNQNRV